MINIPNVTQAEVNELLSGLKASGQATVVGNIIEGRGARAAYSQPDGALQIDVIHGPWGVPKYMVERHIEADLTKALASIRGQR